MSLIALTDIDGYTLVINSDCIVSIAHIQNSYHGSKATIKTQDGTTHTVRETPLAIFDRVEKAQQSKGE